MSDLPLKKGNFCTLMELKFYILFYARLRYYLRLNELNATMALSRTKIYDFEPDE